MLWHEKLIGVSRLLIQASNERLCGERTFSSKERKPVSMEEEAKRESEARKGGCRARKAKERKTADVAKQSR